MSEDALNINDWQGRAKVVEKGRERQWTAALSPDERRGQDAQSTSPFAIAVREENRDLCVPFWGAKKAGGMV
ncbi:hypothetical protein GCM10011499_13220 [Pelagibacterium lentulum]|uniref:Uncharacterized protein n=1 Tax=Pelagibacterium lentulum TaxID=2029865 RepID=A0A916R893_9HYPH|nr:hypothetical protein GCM10011499_13220 [Pelagibacterium lentulum]